ncbi:MAG: 4-(cytidine 5'-diphospho)-2-C-methyl-D-erythritol kinase [Acidobacteriota bacterium]
MRACAKINLTLRVTGVRADGYHGLRTVFQSLAIHDTLTFGATRGPFRIECNDPQCPTDESNLVWRAASLVWRAAGRRGEPRAVTVRIVKRIPMQSGLGGGSSDAAAAIRGLGRLWRITLPEALERSVAARLGADVPFFLDGGTALGLERGDLLFPLVDFAPTWVTLVIPPFGVSTQDAFGWFDADRVPERLTPSIDRPNRRRDEGGFFMASTGGRHTRLARGEYRNDLEASVAARHPDISRIARALRRRGAHYSAMSGSGSSVFGLFTSRALALQAAVALSKAGRRAVVTATVSRTRYAALSTPRGLTEEAPRPERSA